jgi:hypothetical protein
MRSSILLAIIVAAAASHLAAQERREMTLGWIFSDEGEAIAAMPNAQ